MEKELNIKNVSMTSVINIPGRELEAYGVGTDGKIWNTNQPKEPYEAGVNIS